jgi:predicted aminopeptidase
MHRIVTAVVLLACSGCFSGRYLLQAAGGEYELLHVARPISKVVADPAVPPRIRYLLAQVDAIKSWGQSRGLKPTRNYTRYSDLHRPAAVWVVQACAPLSFEVRRWHFPIVGSVPYLGFFEESAAREYANQLSKGEPVDVAVRTAAAFSTLGWFRDPVLSTMIPEGDEALGQLAEVILHESVHATIYIPNQSALNESLASFIGEGLTKELLVENFGVHAAVTREYLAGQARYDAWSARLHQAYDELDALYKSKQDDEVKRAEKAGILAAVQKELRLRQLPNNATLSGSRTYATGKGGFERLYAACGSWPAMLDAVGSLTEADFEMPQQEELDPLLDRLIARTCGTSSKGQSSRRE